MLLKTETYCILALPGPHCLALFLVTFLILVLMYCYVPFEIQFLVTYFNLEVSSMRMLAYVRRHIEKGLEFS